MTTYAPMSPADPAAKVRRLFGAPLVVTLFFFGMMLPTSVSVSLGGLRLSVYRVVLLFALLPMLSALAAGQTGQDACL